MADYFLGSLNHTITAVVSRVRAVNPTVPQLKFASVDCTAHAELCERFGVTSGTAAERAAVEDPEEPVVPHIAWFRDGDNQGVYDGPADHGSKSIVAWAEDKHSKGLLRLGSSA